MNPLATIGLASGGTVRIYDDRADVSEVRLLPDILEPMNYIGRFGGQIKWSDAQHIGIGLSFLPRHQWGHWLLHESGEALGIGDVNFAVKRAFGTRMKEVEQWVIDGVYERAGLSIIVDPAIHDFDRAIGSLEAMARFPQPAWVAMFKAYGLTPEGVIHTAAASCGWRSGDQEFWKSFLRRMESGMYPTLEEAANVLDLRNLA